MDLLDCNKTTVWRNLKNIRSLDALLQETRGGRHREYRTYEEEQAFLKRHIETAQAGEFVTVNQLFASYQKEISRTSTRDGCYYLLKRHGSLLDLNIPRRQTLRQLSMNKNHLICLRVLYFRKIEMAKFF